MTDLKSNSAGIYDASVLGKPKMMLLGFQHLFAMFGAFKVIFEMLSFSTSLLKISNIKNIHQP